MSHADAGRLIHLSKKREREKEDIEQRKKQVEDEAKKREGIISTFSRMVEFSEANIGSKFTANYDAVEEHLKSATVGLVTLDDMRELQKDVVVDRWGIL